MTASQPLDDTKVHSDLTPHCAACGRVRDMLGRWLKAKPLPADFDESKVTHTICPTCLKKLYPEFLKRRQRQRKPD